MCRAKIDRYDLPGLAKSKLEKVDQAVIDEQLIKQPSYIFKPPEGRLRSCRRKMIMEKEDRQRVLNKLVALRNKMKHL